MTSEFFDTIKPIMKKLTLYQDAILYLKNKKDKGEINMAWVLGGNN